MARSVRSSNCGFNLKSFRPLAFAVLAVAFAAPPMFASRPAPTEPHHYLVTGQVNAADRYFCQTQIEFVYYSHRIWPKENSTPKPAFEVMVPAADIQAAVAKFTQDSNTLEHQDGLTITTEQLNAEIARMVQTTNDPVMLQELFDALNDDPTLVAECLARPNLVNHLILETPPAAHGSSSSGHPSHPNGGPPPAPVYILPVINTASCSAWSPLRSGPPDKRTEATAIWTGSEMIVWGGNGAPYLNTGGRYNPAIDYWLPTSTVFPMPFEARIRHTAIWTGTEMIIWGGIGSPGGVLTSFNDGARYNPVTDSWIMTELTDAPSARSLHTAVWTNSEMIVWGGTNGDASGGRYNPACDHPGSGCASWAPTSTNNGAPTARIGHTAVWTGSKMIIWGGGVAVNGHSTGGLYDPALNSWQPIAFDDTSPIFRAGHSAVWDAARNQMIVWGGHSNNGSCSVPVGNGDCNTGGRYNPACDYSGSTCDIWTDTAIDQNTPAARSGHTTVWTGTEMIVWGGTANNVRVNSGGRYDPITNQWQPTSTGANVLEIRELEVAVWAGDPASQKTTDRMIIWGGNVIWPDNNPPPGLQQTGGRYNPATDSWQSTYLGLNVPTPRSGHTSVWTGAEMIVWGAAGPTGGRFYPAINDWALTGKSTAGCKDSSGNTSTACYPGNIIGGHTAIWNGSRMLIWGGKEQRGNPPKTFFRQQWRSIQSCQRSMGFADHEARPYDMSYSFSIMHSMPWSKLPCLQTCLHKLRC